MTDEQERGRGGGRGRRDVPRYTMMMSSEKRDGWQVSLGAGGWMRHGRGGVTGRTQTRRLFWMFRLTVARREWAQADVEKWTNPFPRRQGLLPRIPGAGARMTLPR